MILFRYLAREVYSSLISVTLVVVFIFLANQIVRLLSEVARGNLASNVVLQLIALYLPSLIGLLLPLGLFLGVLISFGRLYAENEMTILFASGMSRWQLIKYTLMMASAVFVLVAILMYLVNPLIAAEKEKILSQASSNNVVATLVPGRFQNISGAVAYVGNISNDKTKAEEVFVAEHPKRNGQQESFRHKPEWSVLAADTAHQYIDPESGQTYMVAVDGYRYEGLPGEHDFSISKFKEYGVRLQQFGLSEKKMKDDAIPTLELLQGYKDDLIYRSELEWRNALPISVFLLAIAGALMSKVNPRQGRFQRFVPAILVYMIYANLIFVGRDWVENSRSPASLGLWWVHGLLLGFILLLLLFQSERVKFFLFRRKERHEPH